MITTHDRSAPMTSAPPYYGQYARADEAVDARALTRIVQRHRKLIFVTVAVISGFSALVAFNLTPRYTGLASVTIDPHATRVVNTEAVLQEGTADLRTIETQIRLLQSRSFAERLITRADLLSDPEFNPALLPPEAPGLIETTVDQFTAWLSRSVLAHAGMAMPASAPAEPPRPHSPLATLDSAIDRVLGRLEVGRVGESYAISIQFTSTDPVKAARIANEIARQYVEEQLGGKQGAAARAAAWLRGRLAEMRDTLLETENAIANYKADNGLIDSTNKGVTLNAARLTALHTQLIETRAQRAEKESKLGLLRQLRGGGAGFEAVNEIITSPLITNLRTFQTELLREEAQLAQEYGPRHPKLLQARAEKQKVTDKIHQEVQNIIGALEASLDDAKQNVALGQRAEVHLNELEREAETTSTLYKALLERYKKLTEQQETIEAGAEGISPGPVPNGPSFPQPKLILAAGFTSSLMIAGVLALIAESLQSGLRSTRQIESTLGVSCLSHVPRVQDKDGCPPHQFPTRKPRSAYAEAIRAVHVGLQFAHLEK